MVATLMDEAGSVCGHAREYTLIRVMAGAIEDSGEYSRD